MRLRSIAAAVLTILILAPPVTAAPAARDILDDVVARLPSDAILIGGELIVRKRRGVVTDAYRFLARLDLGATPPRAQYTVLSPEGDALEQLTVVRHGGRPPSFTYAVGEALSPTNVPDLYASVQNSSIAWMDLSLGFLWWRNAAYVGNDEVRGRACEVVDAFPPGEGAPYARVRLWIDQRLRALLQAEAYDEHGTPLRRLWVKSFKKIDERWMLKDLEVEQAPGLERTKLRVHDVAVVPDPHAAE